MKLRFIINPAAGAMRRRPELEALVRRFLRERHLTGQLNRTNGPGHATELATAAVADGCTGVVAIGGDGTINEVAQALLGGSVQLGIVPAGSGNGLAAHLGIPGDFRAALELAAAPSPRTRLMDTGEVNGYPFLNVMGLGLDAEVAARFNRLARRGLPAYVRTTWRAFRARHVERLLIRGNGEPVHLEVLLAAVANSDQYGNGASIAPGARVDDGMLDLVAIQPVGWWGAARLAAALFLGRIDRSSSVRRWRGDRFVIERSRPAVFHTDGEVRPAVDRLEIRVRPGSLQVLVPNAGLTGRGPPTSRRAALSSRP